MQARQDILERLREAALSSGLSMKRLADDSGLYYQSVHGFIRGNRVLTLRSVEKLAGTLGFELQLVRRSKRRK